MHCNSQIKRKAPGVEIFLHIQDDNIIALVETKCKLQDQTTFFVSPYTLSGRGKKDRWMSAKNEIKTEREIHFFVVAGGIEEEVGMPSPYPTRLDFFLSAVGVKITLGHFFFSFLLGRR